MKARRWFGASLVVLSLVPGRALAQAPANPSVINQTDNMSFDRPEAWALKRFTSSTLLEGLDTPRTRTAGAIELGVEAGWLPSLSVAQQRVGFDGTTPQDLNKAPMFFRPRVTIGLPARWSLTAAVVPPVRAFGVKALLAAVAIERPVYESDRWTVGVRGYGQLGHVEAAFTCPASALAFAPGSSGNILGCQATSSDTSTFHYVGGEVGFGYGAAARVSPHAAVSLNYLDMAFQVNALTYGANDRTRLLAHGMTMAASGGITYRVGNRLAANLDAFYTPLSVRRTIGAAAQNDGLFNIRALFTYRLR